MASPFGSPRRSRLAAARYWARLFWFPVVCLVFMVFALRQADDTNSAVDERPRVEMASANTPVLSARRLPNLLALPSQAAQLQGPVLSALSGVPPDTTCASVTNSRGLAVFQHNPTLLLSPASNQKVLLAYALLSQFDPNRTFGTYVASDAQVLNNTVQGNVWLIGTGDPVLSTDNYAKSFIVQPRVHSSFESLADQLKAAGITRIRGNVVADATRYDNVRYHPNWPARFAANAVVGPVSALAVNGGYTAFPEAGQEQAGSGPRSASADPARDAAELLIGLLRQRGITVEGKAELGPVPQSPTFLAQLESPPLKEIVGQMLRTSDNTAAEMMFKELGVARVAKGSFEGGAAALTGILTEKGLALPGMNIVDGSGLDTGNLVPCATLNGVLVAAGRSSDLAAGLAVAAQSGTLKDRFINTPAAGKVLAKTGSLDTVTSLAGFVDTRKGETVTFAIIVNTGGDSEQFKAVEEQLVLTLMDYPGGPDIADLMPLP